MDKTIVTALLVIAGVISAVFVFNSLYPAVVDSSNAMLGMQRRIDDRLQTQIEIVHATGDGGSNALLWVKNVGAASIRGVENCDLFFGTEGNFARIPHKNEGGGTPYWEYTLVNESDDVWQPTATLGITITYGSLLAGQYYAKMVLPNGISDDLIFSE